MSAPTVLVVIIIFAAATSPSCTAADDDAGSRPPEAKTKSLPPASAVEQEFIRTRCNDSCRLRPEAARECNKILLPHAASINGSYIRSSLTAVTITVSELTALARELGELDRARPQDKLKLGGCVRTVEETVGGAKEQLATLKCLDAVGDEKMGEFDLHGVAGWIKSVEKNFRQQCSENGDLKDLPRELPRVTVVDNSIFASVALIFWSTPYSLRFMPSP